jgi:hypothetical protein
VGLGTFFDVLFAILKKGGIGVNVPINATGFKSMKSQALLFDIICAVYDNPHYKPGGGLTYCNMAAQDICTAFNCQDFNNKMANEIVDFVEKSDNWEEVEISQVQWKANMGSLVFAMQKGDPHGHICVIRPGMEKLSGKWNCMVPSVMNVGKINFIDKGVNWSFEEMPRFYALKTTL